MGFSGQGAGKSMGGDAGRFSEENLNALRVAQNIETCMEKICQIYNLDHVAYHLGYKNVDGVEIPYLKTNYPAQWVGRYVVKNYLQIDPVAKAGYELTTSKSWADLDWSSECSQAFMEDAAAHGVGQSGLVVPVIDKNHRRAMVNFSNNFRPEKWARHMAKNQDQLVRCAGILHQKALDDLYPDRAEGPKLSPRELECLKLASNGLEASEIAKTLSLSEHTIRDYLKAARGKLGCTNIAQAVRKATMQRLI